MGRAPWRRAGPGSFFPLPRRYTATALLSLPPAGMRMSGDAGRAAAFKGGVGFVVSGVAT